MERQEKVEYLQSAVGVNVIYESIECQYNCEQFSTNFRANVADNQDFELNPGAWFLLLYYLTRDTRIKPVLKMVRT